MYKLKTAAVYAHETVLADARYKSRLDRVVAALDAPTEVTVFSDAELPRLLAEKQLLARRVPMGTLRSIPDPVLIFNTFRFDERRQERERFLGKLDAPGGYHLREALTGCGPFCWFTEEDLSRRICRPCWRLHFQNGCAHKCHYCALGGLLVTMVNVEDYISQLDRLIKLHPWQETYLFEDDAEVLCLEPELDCLGRMIEYFGTLEDRYLIIHAKSANVDWMLNLKHNGRTIIVWSVCTPSQAKRFEPAAASATERIEAARKAQHAGYVVRYKFKPIIPMRDWREQAAETVRLMLQRTQPDVVSLCVFMWTDFADMKQRLDLSLLDQDFVAAAEAAQERLKGESTRPFPPEVRAEIYELYLREIRKHNGSVPVSLSTESPVVWKVMSDKLGYQPHDYVCGCGPNSIPGRRRLACNPFTITAAGPQGGFERM